MPANTMQDATETWSPRLLQLGGVLLAGHAITSGIKAFTTISTPPDLFVTTGHLVALLGLLGLYPLFVSGSRLLSKLALATGVVGVLAWLAMTVAKTLVAVGVIPSIWAVLPAALVGVLLISTVLAYGLFFAAATQAGWLTLRLRLLLATPGLLIVLLMVDSAVTGASNLDGLLIGGALACAMLGLGHAIRTSTPSPRSGHPFDAAVEG